jgi:acyl carrier protein
MTAIDEPEIKLVIRKFISTSVAMDQLKDDDDLFESGVVNSLFAVQLMTFLERTFGIAVDMDDLEMANFKSLNATTAFVLQKLGA